MTALDRLAKQIKRILLKQKELEAENRRLKKQLNIYTNAGEAINSLQQEKNRQNEEIKKLTKQIESLLR